MSERLNAVVQAIRNAFARPVAGIAGALSSASSRAAAGIVNARGLIVAALLVGGAGYALVKHPPVQTVERGHLGVRHSQLTGRSELFREGTVWVLPGLHTLQRYPLRDQVYRPLHSAKASGEAPFQSVEGLSIGVERQAVSLR